MLELYEKAIHDAETALKLNENSLKTWLLLAKAYYKSEKLEKFQEAVKQAKEKNPKQTQFIDGNNKYKIIQQKLKIQQQNSLKSVANKTALFFIRPSTHLIHK